MVTGSRSDVGFASAVISLSHRDAFFSNLQIEDRDVWWPQTPPPEREHCDLDQASEFAPIGFEVFLEELSVRLPSDRDIAIGEKPNVDEQSMYAKDLRGIGRAYHPAKELDSPEIQQVFAHLRKDALSTLRNVVSVLA
jgi:hypothetical protein